MAPPAPAPDATRSELLSRRERLAAAVEQIPENAELRSLLGEVDAGATRDAATGRFVINLQDTFNRLLAADVMVELVMDEYPEGAVHLMPARQVEAAEVSIWFLAQKLIGSHELSATTATASSRRTTCRTPGTARAAGYGGCRPLAAAA